jgi:hypothetical protein
MVELRIISASVIGRPQKRIGWRSVVVEHRRVAIQIGLPIRMGTG